MKQVKLTPKKAFMKCGTCSSAMFHLLNQEFDNLSETEEKACDLLAGGVAQKGHQCGMLWGASLAVGAESLKRHRDKNDAIASSITASQYIVESFEKRTKTVNCREISGIDWENKLDFALYMAKTILQGFVYSPCFKLIDKWTPEAIQAANKGFACKKIFSKNCISCASEVVKKMGASEQESIIVSGFAGGIGLSGNGCGALSAAIWYKMLDWAKKNIGKNPAFFNNQDVKSLLRSFYIQTDSEMLCRKICGKQFESIDEHSDYIRSGGCKNIIEALANSR
jgi:C_GCAxxG_C_C family probable redox protein